MVNEMDPLLSVIILSYNNTKFLKGAIDSVIMQDYPSIELIISNDASNDFDKEAIASYVSLKKLSNIKIFQVIQNEINLGTVKHANKCVKISSGEYIRFLSADDEFYNKNVLSQTMNCIAESGASIVTSLSAVYDANMLKILRYYPTEEKFKKLSQLNNTELFEEMCCGNVIGATGITIRKQVFEVYGYFNERYVLTEDWPMWLRLIRQGVKIHFHHIVSVKYRSGGVSNGKNQAITKVLKNDLIEIFKNEIMPYSQALSFAAKREIDYIYNKANKWERMNVASKTYFILRYLDVIMFRRLGTTIEYFRRRVNL